MTAARSAGVAHGVDQLRGAGARVAVVDAVDVGQQDERVGPGDVRHERGEPVVVAEPDLLGGDRVVLVDDRQRAEGEQPVDGLLGVAVVAAAGQVVGGQQHLADGDVVPGERVGVGLHQPQLADARRRLGGGQVAGPAAHAQRRQTGGDRAGGDEDDLAARGPHRAEDVDQRRQPRGVEAAGQRRQRRGADLDHDPPGARDRRAGGHARRPAGPPGGRRPSRSRR